ncbi:MAG: RecX family transcriptional regulator [Firmicutes bacterium]|nr:RecX family transcriptional regulator [Bacillota bacterium]
MKSYLKGKGYEEDVIDDVIEQMKEYHYIDDYQFAEMYFAYGFEKGRGVSRIRRELAEKGVSSDIIDMVYEDLEEMPDETEMAMAIAEPIINGIDMDELDYDARQKLKAKIGRRLMSRGFNSDVAYKVIGRLVK